MERIVADYLTGSNAWRSDLGVPGDILSPANGGISPPAIARAIAGTNGIAKVCGLVSTSYVVSELLHGALGTQGIGSAGSGHLSHAEIQAFANIILYGGPDMEPVAGPVKVLSQSAATARVKVQVALQRASHEGNTKVETITLAKLRGHWYATTVN